MGFRLSWAIVRAIRDLSKNTFLLCSSEFFFKGPILVMPHNSWLFESFGSCRSLIKLKEFMFVRKSVSCFWEEEGTYPSSSTSWHPLPAPPPQHPLCSSSSTGCYRTAECFFSICRPLRWVQHRWWATWCAWCCSPSVDGCSAGLWSTSSAAILFSTFSSWAIREWHHFEPSG